MDQEAEQEAANMAWCKEVFHKNYPEENVDDAELCDNGSWKCVGCPWGVKNHDV